MDKLTLNSALQYLIDNRNNLAVVIYALLKDDEAPKKMNIEPESQKGLLDLFLTSFEEKITKNIEVSVMDLSSSDERSNVIYHYDLDVPVELKVLDEVVVTDDHELFDFEEHGIKNIRVLLIEIGDNKQQVVLYKTMSPVNVFSRKNFFLKKSANKFEKINDDFFRVSDNFQLMRTKDGFFVMKLEVLEKAFGFYEVIKKEAESGLKLIGEKNILGNMEALEELVTDIRYARKMTKISKSSPVLEHNTSTDKIIQFCKTYPALSKRIRFNDDETKIVLDTQVSKDLFIKLLMDNFLTSQLTDFLYESLAKDKI